MRGPNGHCAVEPWESCPVSKIDRTMGVSRPRAQASTKYMMSATRYFNLQRGKATSSLGFTEARTTRNYRRKTNRRKKNNMTGGDGGDITQISGTGTRAIGTKSLANEIDIFSRRASHMTEPVKPMKRVLSFHETGDQLHRHKWLWLQQQFVKKIPLVTNEKNPTKHLVHLLFVNQQLQTPLFIQFVYNLWFTFDVKTFNKPLVHRV